MNICELYDIQKIVISLEAALLIDGVDYAEKDVDTIIRNIKTRILRQYQVDLSEVKITDTSLYIGKSRNKARLLLENIQAIHANLCGYLQIVRFTGQTTIKPINVNYAGINEKSFMSILQLSMRNKTVVQLNDAIEVLKLKVGTINTCMEKKLLLILIVCYELGFTEITAAVAEILYFGGKI